MKKLITALLSLPLILALLVVLAVGIAMQQDIASKSDIEFLINLGKREGLAAVIATIRTELYGVDPSAISDPSYGREQVAGRGHAPHIPGRPTGPVFIVRFTRHEQVLWRHFSRARSRAGPPTTAEGRDSIFEPDPIQLLTGH